MFSSAHANPFRIMANVLGGLLLLLGLTFAVSKGLPKPAGLPHPEKLAIVGFAAALFGLLIAFRWPAAGGAISILGFLCFWAVNVAHNGGLRVGGVFSLFLLAATLHLASAWRSRLKPK